MAEDPEVELDESEQKATTAEQETSVGITEASATKSSTKSNVEHQIPVLTTGATGLAHLQRILSELAGPEKQMADMSSHRFWSTQPVPKYDEARVEIEEGPIKTIRKEQVASEPSPLLDGFEWVTMDLTKEEQVTEVFQLLYEHYVEDDDSEFRLHYSPSFLRWALQAPGWIANWHVGVRVTTSRKLVAFISGIPISLRVRQNTFHASEINFLCVRKKLRGKRLAPVLMKEITRRCYLDDTWQAIYTGGKLLPTPVSTCRYFHRSLDWKMLYDVGFAHCPSWSTPEDQIQKYALPAETSTPNLRAMEPEDVDAVHDLLSRYLDRFDIAQIFSKEEVAHWFLQGPLDEQVVWSYVNSDKQVTDFFSFYALNSSIINNEKHQDIRAAYLFYYATETALSEHSGVESVKMRLQALINDALILAKRFNFAVFNLISAMDNPLFIDELKFRPGTGQLHYYLYNYKANVIAGGVDDRQEIEENQSSGVGFVAI